MNSSLENDGPRNEIVASVCVTTFNRYDYLANLLNILSLLDFDHKHFEILIVDNSDDNAAKVEFYDGRAFAPNMRLLNSYPRGLSRARNVGLQEARGRYVLYADDDTEPTSTWLREIVTVFENYPDAAAVGGPILPIWPEGRPTWIPKKFEPYLTVLDQGNELKRLGDGEYLYGANIAFRTEVLRQFGGFPVELGRRGSIALLSDEETYVQDEMRRAGHSVYYTPHGIVYHYAHRHRLDQGWFRRRVTWQAVSYALKGSKELGDAQSYLVDAAAAASKLGMDSSFVNCFVHSEDPEIINAQLDFLLRFTGAALASNAQVTQSGSDAIKTRLPEHLPKVLEAKEKISVLSLQLAEAQQAQVALLGSTSRKVSAPLKFVKKVFCYLIGQIPTARQSRGADAEET